MGYFDHAVTSGGAIYGKEYCKRMDWDAFYKDSNEYYRGAVLELCKREKGDITDNIRLSTSGTSIANFSLFRTGDDKRDNDAVRRSLLDHVVGKLFSKDKVVSMRNSTLETRLGEIQKKLCMGDKDFGKIFSNFGVGKPLTVRRVMAILECVENRYKKCWETLGNSINDDHVKQIIDQIIDTLYDEYNDKNSKDVITSISRDVDKIKKFLENNEFCSWYKKFEDFAEEFLGDSLRKILEDDRKRECAAKLAKIARKKLILSLVREDIKIDIDDPHMSFRSLLKTKEGKKCILDMFSCISKKNNDFKNDIGLLFECCEENIFETDLSKLYCAMKIKDQCIQKDDEIIKEFTISKDSSYFTNVLKPELSRITGLHDDDLFEFKIVEELSNDIRNTKVLAFGKWKNKHKDSENASLEDYSSELKNAINNKVSEILVAYGEEVSKFEGEIKSIDEEEKKFIYEKTVRIIGKALNGEKFGKLLLDIRDHCAKYKDSRNDEYYRGLFTFMYGGSNEILKLRMASGHECGTDDFLPYLYCVARYLIYLNVDGNFHDWLNELSADRFKEFGFTDIDYFDAAKRNLCSILDIAISENLEEAA